MSEMLIQARGLTKTYGDFVAVDGIDFDVAKGESFGFLGPNGAGKSTTMRIIGATSVRTSGTLTILGKDPEVNLVYGNCIKNVAVKYFFDKLILEGKETIK